MRRSPDLEPVRKRPRRDLALERLDRGDGFDLLRDRLDARVVEAQSVEHGLVELPGARLDVCVVGGENVGGPGPTPTTSFSPIPRASATASSLSAEAARPASSASRSTSSPASRRHASNFAQVTLCTRGVRAGPRGGLARALLRAATTCFWRSFRSVGSAGVVIGSIDHAAPEDLGAPAVIRSTASRKPGRGRGRAGQRQRRAEVVRVAPGRPCPGSARSSGRSGAGWS